MFQYSPQSDQAGVKSAPEWGDQPNLQEHLRAAIRDVLGDRDRDRDSDRRRSRGVDRELNGKGRDDLPLHEPSGERTRKTYDFTREWLYYSSVLYYIYYSCSKSYV